MLEGNLRGQQHLGIPVVDLAAAKAWYVGVLGFQVIHEPVLPTQEGPVHASFLRRNDLTLELYRLAGAALDEIRGRGPGHIDHFALDVLDLDAALAAALAAGAVLDDSMPEGPLPLEPFWSQGARYVMLRGPSSEKVELNQRLDLDPARRAENLGGWSHLGVPVTDLERSADFYARLGFREIMRASLPAADGTIQARMLDLAGFVVELYQLTGDDRAAIRRRGDGHIDHMALDVRDIEAAFVEAREAGLEIIEQTPEYLPFWERGARYFTFRGPDGEKIELNQIF